MCQLGKEFERIADRGRGGHIDSRALEERHRVGRAAAGQEREIIVHRGLAFAQNALRQRNGGRKSGGILLDIEIIIEVRDACPLERDFVIEDNILAVVITVELPVLSRERFGGERFALADLFAAPQLKLGKHGLPVQRAAELLEEMVDEIGAAALVGRGL